MATREAGDPTGRGTLTSEHILSERDKVLYQKIIDALQQTYTDQDWSTSQLRESLLENLVKAQVHKVAQYGETDESRSIAASTLVLKGEDWLEWANSVDLNLDVVGKPFPEVDAIKASVAYPTGLLTLEEDYYASIQHGTAFVRSITSWIANDQAIKWDSSPHRPPFWDLLINEWSFAKDAVNASDYEAGQRCLVDSLMMLIFSRSLERQRQYEVLIEKELALPGPKSSVPPRVRASFAKPDIAVMKGFPSNMFRQSRDILTDKSLLHCLKHWALFPNQLLLGILAVEAKRFDDIASPRQLAMYASSMQYQRRALGLKDKPVYGVIVLRGIFQLYVCCWDDQDQLWCCKALDACWDLNTADGFVKCLYFLRALRARMDASFDDDLKSFSIENLVAHLQRNPKNWRARPPKRLGDSQGNDPKKMRLGGGQVDDEVSVDEDDDLSESSSDTPQKRLERIFDIVITSYGKACEFAKWLHTLPPVEHKEAYGHQVLA